MLQTIAQNPEPVKHIIDMASIGALVATFFGWLPHVTAMLTLVWMCIRIYETKTVQRFLNRRKRGRK